MLILLMEKIMLEGGGHLLGELGIDRCLWCFLTYDYINPTIESYP